jgi:hypothetical protein
MSTKLASPNSVVSYGAPLQHIMKATKRNMVADYSRALSEQTSEAHALLLARGYKPGCRAGKGVRRLCLLADGSVRRMLA